MSEMKRSSHLCTKSSVFHPTQLCAGGQEEIIRHMKRHYDKLQHVTSATDTSPPKSFRHSTLARDRLRKCNSSTPENFKLSITPKPIKVKEKDLHNDMISLPTQDSDVRSILRHVPELRKSLKFKSSLSQSSFNTKDLQNIVEQEEMSNVGYNIIRPDISSKRTDVTSCKTSDVYRSPDKAGNRSASPTRTVNCTPNKLLGNEQDLELQYLTFVSDITREVLHTNITSDRALKMLFERHIRQNIGRLNERVMRLKIEELKVKLNINS